MREEIRDKERLNHIIESVDNIFEFIKNVSFQEYTKNKMLKYADLKILKLSVRHQNLLTSELKEKYKHIPWHAVTG